MLAIILSILDARGKRHSSLKADGSDLRLCQSVRKQERPTGNHCAYSRTSQETPQLPGILAVPGVGCGHNCGHGAFPSIYSFFPSFVHDQHLT